MNTNKKNLSLITRAKNSLVGRICRRVMGEETGAVMMEYVILAVLIAAAVAVGAWYFGRSVNNEMRVASHGVTGDDVNAQSAQLSAQGNVQKQDNAAKTAQKAYINTANEAAAHIK